MEYFNPSQPRMISSLLFGVILMQVCLLGSVYGITCRNEEGKDVDWFLVYKLPSLQDDPPPLNTGYSYAFVTGPEIGSSRKNRRLSPSASKLWFLSDSFVTNRTSMLSQTLEPLYQRPKEYSYVLYNDAPPLTSGRDSSSNFAHAKGVVGMDESTGFWLVHSVPQFPEPPNGSYQYPKSGRENGQTAICISFVTQDVGSQVVTQLNYMRPNVYSISVTSEMERMVPQMIDLKNRKWPKNVNQKIQEIKSISGEVFTSFSRNSKGAAAGDLYSSLIAPWLKTNLLVETWRRGAGSPLDSNCSSQYTVRNVQEVQLNFTRSSQVSTTGPFKYMEDHSKWAVSDSRDNSYACVGDINRMRSQFKRGGGSVCFRNLDVWSLMQSSVYDVEGCHKPPKNNANRNAHGSGRTSGSSSSFVTSASLFSSIASGYFSPKSTNKRNES